MRMTRRGALALPCSLLAAPALAQNWPDRPIRMVIAFPAGSVTDTLFRNLAEPLSHVLGQPVVIENRPGGNGVVGTIAAKTAPADGHTWVVLSVTNGALNPYMVRSLGYDPLNDFTHIGQVAEAPYLLVSPMNGATSVADLIERAKARPGQLTFSYGNYSSLIASAQMNRTAGVTMTSVPYRGGPEALTDVMAGRIDSTFTDFANGMAQVREGRVRALGVTTAQPFALAPEIPPVGASVPGFSLTVWFGLATNNPAPAGMQARANAALNRVLADTEVGARLARLGYTPTPGTVEHAKTFLGSEIARYAELAAAVGLERQ